MRVRFTKVDGSRYAVAVDRDRGPALLPRFGPGHDDLMPHDLAHYLVEEYYEIALGVWGQLAAGGGGIFWPAPEDNTLQNKRRVQRIATVGRGDMARSEQLVMLTVAAWEKSIGRVKHQTRPVGGVVDADLLGAAVRRFTEVSGRWSALPYGGSLVVTWPDHLTVDLATSRQGRRNSRRTPHRARY